MVEKAKEAQKQGSLASADLNHPVMFEVLLNNSLLSEAERTTDALAEHAMTVWNGGFDTVGFSLTGGVYCVLRHPRVSKRLQEELKEVWPDPMTHLPMSTLENLPYLNAVIKETLRLMPGAVCRVTRVNTSQPTQFQGYSLPAGTLMSMSLPMVLHDPSIWGTDHGEFRPERWLGDNAAELEKYLVSFSKGTRICPGIELAWIELRLIMGTLFRRFDMRIPTEVTIEDEDIFPYYDGFTPVPRNRMHRLPVKATPLM